MPGFGIWVSIRTAPLGEITLKKTDMKSLSIVKASEVDNFSALVWEFNRQNWPEFMFHDPIATACWPALHEHFAEYQFAITEGPGEAVIVQANSIPLAWNGRLEDLPDKGWDWALQQGIKDRTLGLSPTHQCALQIAIGPDYRGQGISACALEVMKQIGREKGLGGLVAPVRPNRKADYPATTIEDYIGWTTEDGLPFDPWLRVHVRAGGKIIKVCHKSMMITGKVADWEGWTGMNFPVSGQYEVPGALVPVTIDREADTGRYVEPNVWVCHGLR